MSFSNIREVCVRFSDAIRQSAERELIVKVYVPEPVEPENELYFVKLVSWCYVFAFEASQPVARYIISSLRAADPSSHKEISTIFENINNLRTVQAHNLLPNNKSDDFKNRKVQIWFLQNSGNPIEWARACSSLRLEMQTAIQILLERWGNLTINAEDGSLAVANLLATIDRDWPPHLFDSILVEVVRDLGLEGFDCIKYRESRIEKWRELVGFFEGPDYAESAMKIAIRNEIRQIFGSGDSR